MYCYSSYSLYTRLTYPYNSMVGYGTITRTVSSCNIILLPETWQNVEYTINTVIPRQTAAIFQTTFSNVFYWMKIFEFRLEFHCSLFLRFQLTSIPLKFVPKVPIDNKALDQIMAWRQTCSCGPSHQICGFMLCCIMTAILKLGSGKMPYLEYPVM